MNEHQIITFVCVAVCFWIVWYALNYIGLPEPFNKVAKVVLMVAAVIYLIRFVMSFA